MPKIRVYKIAEELNIDSKILIDKLDEFGMKVKTHMSALEENEAKLVIDYYKEENLKKQEASKPMPQKQEPQKQEHKKQEPQKQTQLSQALQKQEPHKQNQPRQNPPRQNPQNQEPQRQNQPRQYQPRQTSQNQEPQRQNQPRQNQPRQTSQNQEPQRQNQPRQNQLRQSPQRQEPQRQNLQNQQNQQRQAPKQEPAKPEFKKQDQKKPDQRKPETTSAYPKKNEPVKTGAKSAAPAPEAKHVKKNNKQNDKKGRKMETENIKEDDDIKVIQLGKTVTVRELAEKLGKTGAEVIKVLMKSGVMASLNEEVDFKAASKVAESMDIMVEQDEEVDLLKQAFGDDDDPEESKKERPPVVVVMGHVDHGKTSLLDAIRKSSVTKTEAGGITQRIGAYTVTVNDKPVTFLDTPGHEAFTAMRMRGAQVTDIAVLVVAADDGVMPQTIEAINHAKAAKVEIIVAINKMDKPSANPDRVKQELVEYGLQAEDWGGETICVPVSAINKTGIDHLLEMITLVAEMRELKANPDKKARGTVIEAQLDKGRGPVATVLIQDGTLNTGDPVVAGSTFGRIRLMMDDKGNRVDKAGPSMPVEILGLSEVPHAGDMFYVAQNEKQARMLAESIIAQGRENLLRFTTQKVSLDDLFSQIKAGNVKDLNIVVKADVQGSVEALKTSLERLSNEEVRIRTIHGGVGAITESDVMLASASNAIIIGFNVRPEASARSVATLEKVDIRLYRIIYNAIEDITAAMKGMLEPVYNEKITGHAEIRQLFKASGVGTIGGSYVTDGTFTRNSKVRIIRNGKVVYEGSLDTLKRFKDDVREVNAGYECGLLFNRYNDIKEGDIVEAFVMEEVPR